VRYYVKCRDHPEEKIYVRLGGEPATRSDIPFKLFTIACPTSGSPFAYCARDIVAEEGAALPLTGTAVGALLFIFAPLAGVVGAIAGFLGGADKERKRVTEFNES
jgi:hypothetical protein